MPYSVYIGTNGRGIFYGDASGTAPPNTATGTTTATTATTATTTTKPTTTATTTTTTSTNPTGTAPAGAYGQCGGLLCIKTTNQPLTFL